MLASPGVWPVLNGSNVIVSIGVVSSVTGSHSHSAPVWVSEM